MFYSCISTSKFFCVCANATAHRTPRLPGSVDKPSTVPTAPLSIIASDVAGLLRLRLVTYYCLIVDKATEAFIFGSARGRCSYPCYMLASCSSYGSRACEENIECDC